MMIAVMGCPPERAALRRHLGAEGEDELHGAARIERAMREVAMESGRDEEHAQDVEPDAEGEFSPAETDPEHAQRQKMHQ